MAFDLAPFVEGRRRFAEAIGDALAIVPGARETAQRRLELRVPAGLRLLLPDRLRESASGTERAREGQQREVAASLAHQRKPHRAAVERPQRQRDLRQPREPRDAE